MNKLPFVVAEMDTRDPHITRTKHQAKVVIQLFHGTPGSCVCVVVSAAGGREKVTKGRRKSEEKLAAEEKTFWGDSLI